MDTGTEMNGIQISHKKNILKVRNSEAMEEIDIVNLVSDHSSAELESIDKSRPILTTHKIRYTKESLLILDSTFTPIEDLPEEIRRVILPRSNENVWMPHRLVEEKDEKAQITMTFRSILNKMTPGGYKDLVRKLLMIDMATEFHFHTLINLIFEKGTSEQTFSDIYAQLCVDLEAKKPKIPIKPFRHLVVNQCGIEFKKCLEEKDEKLSDTSDIDPELRELKLLKEKEKRIGLMKFIAELYKRKVLSSVRILDCMNKLLKLDKEDSIEQCHMLFVTAGPILTKSGSLC